MGHAAHRVGRQVVVPGVALLARNGTVVGLAVAVASLCDAVLRFSVLHLRFRGPPSRDLPDNAREALELEGLTFPLATGSSAAIESAQTCIDGTLVGLRPELVRRGSEPGVVDSTVLPVVSVSNSSPPNFFFFRNCRGTYSLGFFLGPGFPRGLGSTSPTWCSPLLLPGFGPGTPLRRDASFMVAGVVEPTSDALSAEEAGSAGSAVDTGDDALLSLTPLFSLSSKEPGNRPKRPEDSLRMTVLLLGFSDRLIRPLVEVGDEVVVDAGMFTRVVLQRVERSCRMPGSPVVRPEGEVFCEVEVLLKVEVTGVGFGGASTTGQAGGGRQSAG